MICFKGGGVSVIESGSWWRGERDSDLLRVEGWRGQLDRERFRVEGWSPVMRE